MRVIFLAVLVAMGTMLVAQSPVKKTFAYSRELLAGTPDMDSVRGAPGKPISTTYYIYVAVKKDAVLTVRNVWMLGKNYAATMLKVPSPVLVDHDLAVPTGKKDTLVARTTLAVYHVDLANERGWTTQDSTAKRLTQANELVVFLESGRQAWYGFAKKIKKLRPAYGM